ncbi:hypothetical protein [Kitasatospora sp. NPDC059571]|uniref:hypothetical protein n=1 Tax=Kitasatospora sp. NPDC059571 TaxID=3346871 RepID=UPI0036AB9FD0
MQHGAPPAGPGPYSGGPYPAAGTAPMPGVVPQQHGGQAGAPGIGPAQAPPGRGRQRVRGLLWGVGGVLLASAVWATAVLTVPKLVATGDPAPGTGPYHLVDDMCTDARLTTFASLYPTESGKPYHYSTRHSALDDMYCSQYLKKTGADTDYVSLYLEAQLHKAVDPQPEFDAQRAGLEQRHYQTSSVPDLGQDAYVGYLDDPSTSDASWHYITQVLYVRDRGLTYYLSWSGSFQNGKTSPPDREQIRQALIIDSRAVLHTLGGS